MHTRDGLRNNGARDQGRSTLAWSGVGSVQRKAPLCVGADDSELLAPLQKRTLARIIQGSQASHSSWAHTSLRAAACPLEVLRAPFYCP